MALLPRRLSPSRKAIPGRFATAKEAQKALNAAIADIDRKRAAAPGGSGGRTRKMKHLLAEYIQSRTDDATAPLSANTVRHYMSAFRKQVMHPDANLGEVPVSRIDAPSLNKWFNDLKKAGVGRPSISYARRLVSAALNWEVENNGLFANPATAIRIRSTKASRAAAQVVDPVLIPTWKELMTLTCSPEHLEDRLLIALMGWCGLRWSEAVSLDVNSLNPKKSTIAVSRVLTYTPNQTWVVEPVKAGLIEEVYVPKRLMKALVALGESYDGPASKVAGNLLFRVRTPTEASIGVINNRNFTRDVWVPARVAAGLDGDPSLPITDPKRKAIKIKDLRATTASVLVDAGASRLDAAVQLRHADPRTTDKYYSRALGNKHHDPARAAIRKNTNLTLSQRLDALFEAWCKTDPEMVKNRLFPDFGAKNGANPKKEGSKK